MPAKGRSCGESRARLALLPVPPAPPGQCARVCATGFPEWLIVSVQPLQRSQSACLQKCNITKEESVATVVYKCDGAFTFIPMDSNSDVHAHAIFCEGAMFTMTEIELNEDAGQDAAILCPGEMCAHGAFCLANSQIITAGELLRPVIVAMC